ncbi:MAG: Biotin/lipoyl attachment protein [Candidatus Saccharibacteria bacterium]|nr:Biotin/lipoyl attachment protein [Candidatus Saccharibacteria bacterium]
MKLSGKIKFFFGIIFVVLLVGVLTVFLNISMSTSDSVEATLDAQSRTIGTDYPGLVVKQNVEEGQKIAENEVLFEIESQQLNTDLASGALKEESLPFKLNPETKNIEIRSTNAGVIDEIFFREGSYIPASGVITTVYVLDSLFVTAHFQLAPPDYARIEDDSSLELLFPDNTKKEATITSVTLESSKDEEKVDTVVKAKITDANMSDFRFSVGTPVDAKLHLRQDSWFQNIIKVIQDTFTPKRG